MTERSGSTEATITVRVPIVVRQRGGRKLVQIPVGCGPWTPPRPQLDNVLLKAVVKAFRWKRMLDEGEPATISELAVREKLNVSYVSHVLALTLLAPSLVEAILEGTQPATMQLQPLIRHCPIEWCRQLDSL